MLKVRAAPQADFTLRSYCENKVGILKRFSLQPFPQKGWRGRGAEPLVAVRRRRNTPYGGALKRVNSQTVRWTVWEEGKRLQESAFPTMKGICYSCRLRQQLRTYCRKYCGYNFPPRGRTALSKNSPLAAEETRFLPKIISYTKGYFLAASEKTAFDLCVFMKAYTAVRKFIPYYL